MTTTEVGRRLSAHFSEEVCREISPKGSRVGEQWISEESPRLVVELSGERSGHWECADGSSGDILDLIGLSRLESPTKAAEWAAGHFHLEEHTNGAAKPGHKPEKNGHFDPSTHDPLKKGYKRKDETVWRYGTRSETVHDKTGAIIGWEVYFEPGEDPPSVPQRVLDGKTKWGWPRPTPIFNQHLIESRPNDPVLIVPRADMFVASQLFPDHVIVSWMGGQKDVASANWTPILFHGEISLWPEKSQAGREVTDWLKRKFREIRVVDVSSLPENFSLFSAWDHLKSQPRKLKNIDVKALFDARPAAFQQPETIADLPCPFRCLGNEGPVYYYLSHSSGDIVHLRPAEHTDLNLQMIATDDYWMSKGDFMQDKGNGVDYKKVAKFLIQSQHRVGHFNPENVRGLGCWLEGDTVIYHAGDRLYVNGVETALHDHKSRFIYSRRKSIAVNLAAKATIAEGQKLVELCEMLPWAPGQMSWCYAAMIFIAPICGALPWRPHFWLTGLTGSGKSWSYDFILTPMFGDAVLAALSTTSSAGIRQTIQSDAIPVIIDEIESKDEKSQLRIQSMLELVRQSSSETSGSIRMGSPDGKARAYRVRCCFLFSSMVMGALEPADLNRFVRLDFLKRPQSEKQAHFDRLQAFTNQTASVPSWCDAIRARAIVLAPLIRQAAETMRRAISQVSGDARKGQQYGTLAAGYWMLTSDTPPTAEQATAWAIQQDWEPLGAGSDKDSDPSRVIEVLLQYPTTYEDTEGHRHSGTVGELLDIYYLERGGKRDAVYASLMRLGIHPIYDSIDIATRHSELAKVFRNTPYANRWTDHIRRLDKWESGFFKAPGSRTQRCTRIPKNIVCNLEPEPELPTENS